MCQATLFGALALPQEGERARHAAPLQELGAIRQRPLKACRSHDGVARLLRQLGRRFRAG